MKKRTYKAPAKGWNHRVVRREYPGEFPEVMFGIHETFYGLGGDKLPSFTTDASGVVGESVGELRETLNRMLRALDNPVLDYETRKELAREAGSVPESTGLGRDTEVATQTPAIPSHQSESGT